MNYITVLCCSNFQWHDLKSQLTLDFNYTDYPSTIRVKPMMLFATFQIRVLTSESRQMARLGFIVPTDLIPWPGIRLTAAELHLLEGSFKDALQTTAAATFYALFEHVSSF